MENCCNFKGKTVNRSETYKKSPFKEMGLLEENSSLLPSGYLKMNHGFFCFGQYVLNFICFVSGMHLTCISLCCEKTLAFHISQFSGGGTLLCIGTMFMKWITVAGICGRNWVENLPCNSALSPAFWVTLGKSFTLFMPDFLLTHGKFCSWIIKNDQNWCPFWSSPWVMEDLKGLEVLYSVFKILIWSASFIKTWLKGILT